MSKTSERILSYWKQLPLEAIAGKTIKRVYKSDDRLVLLFHDTHQWLYFKVGAQVCYECDPELEPAELTWDDLKYLGVLSEEVKLAHAQEEQEAYSKAQRAADIQRIKSGLCQVSPELRKRILEELNDRT